MAGLTALSCSLNQQALFAENKVYKMNEKAREYWLHGKVGEGLCGVRMQPNLEEIIAHASDGNLLAAFRLGQLYEDGTWSVKQDSEEAIKWYTIAANGGVYNAMISLATIYELGRGAPKDISAALHWFREAQKIKYDDYIDEKIQRYEAEQ